MAPAIRGSRFTDCEAALLEPVEQIDKIGTLYAKGLADLRMLESGIAITDQHGRILRGSNVKLRQSVNKVLKCGELSAPQQVADRAPERAQINGALGRCGIDGLAMIFRLAPASPMTGLSAYQSLDNPGHFSPHFHLTPP